MQYYSVEEILLNTSSYIFVQNNDECLNKKYKVDYIWDVGKYKYFHNWEREPVDQDTVFIPRLTYINSVLSDSYKQIEKLLVQNGCRAFILSEEDFLDKERSEMLLGLFKKHRDKIDLCIMTRFSTMGALYELARYTRAKRIPKKTKVIGVTGSVGKTTTTEMLTNVLNQETRAYRGIPEANIRSITCQKMLDVPEDVEYDYFVIEISGACRGYLSFLSELLMVDMAIITKVSLESTTVFGTLDRIAHEKCTLLKCIPSDSFAILNDCNVLREAAKNYDLEKIFLSDKGDNYTLIDKGAWGSKFVYKDVEYELSAVGEHHISNAIKVIEMAKRLGISTPSIQKGLKMYATIGNRWFEDIFDENLTIVSDVANNSTDSTLNNLKTFAQVYKDKKVRRAAVTHVRTITNYASEIYPEMAREIAKLDYQEIVFFDDKSFFFADCVERYSNGRIKCTKIPGEQTQLRRHDKLVKYLASSISEDEALLIKTDADMGHENLSKFVQEEIVELREYRQNLGHNK